jgi:hypothetical protein
MPRTAAAAQGFATSNGSTRASILPPDDLGELEKRVFVDIVIGSAPNAFLPSDIPTLAAYARAVIAEQVADGELSAAPIGADGRASPWLPIWLGRLRAMTTLSRRLGLNPAGRSPAKPANPANEANEPTSYYSRLAMEARRGPDGH